MGEPHEFKLKKRAIDYAEQLRAAGFKVTLVKKSGRNKYCVYAYRKN